MFRAPILVLTLLALPLAGCLEQAPGGDVAPAEAPAEPTAGKRLLQTTLEGESHFLLKHRVADVSGFVNPEPARFALERTGVRNATLVATWTPSTPLSERLGIWFYPRGAGDVLTAEGTSPVVIEIPGEFFGKERAFFADADPADPGAGYDQRVSYTLTLYYEE